MKRVSTLLVILGLAAQTLRGQAVTSPSQPTAPPNQSYVTPAWLYANKVHYAGAWTATSTYNSQDLVTYAAASYVSLRAGNTGNYPVSAPLWWVALPGGGGGGGGGGAVSSVFGRAGAVTAQTGDYTSDQVSEGSANEYFTAGRAQSAMAGLYMPIATYGSAVPSGLCPSRGIQYWRTGTTPYTLYLCPSDAGSWLGPFSVAAVPYTGATTDLHLGVHALYAAGVVLNSTTAECSSLLEGAIYYTTALPGFFTTCRREPDASYALHRLTLIGDAPTAHAASHQNGGSDEVATATPTANAIPKAGSGGTLAAGWLPAPGAAALGGVESKDCSGTGHVQKINTDGTVTCSADSAGGGSSSTPTLNTDYVKYEDHFTCGYSGTLCLPWFSAGTGQANNAANGAWPHLGVFNIGGSAAAAGNLGYLMLANYQNTYTGLGTFEGLLANGPWELHWIFRLNQTTNTKMAIGAWNSGGYGYETYGIGARFDTTLGDTAYMLTAENGWGGGAVSSGIAPDTSWHHLKIYWVSANKIAMTLDAGTPVTACASGCTITDNTWGTAGWQYAAAAVCGSGAVAAAATMDLDYFGFLANVGGM